MYTILLIEDNEDIRENTADILRLSNYIVETASNGKEGVEAAIRNPPNLIICDIAMPELDGYGVLYAIGKMEALKTTPFIFLTAKSNREDFRKGMQLGADDYLTKPFEAWELLTAVESRLNKAEMIRQEVLHSREVAESSSFSPFTDITEYLTSDRDINTYNKKEMIYSEGNHPFNLFYVVEGKVKTFKRHDLGRDLVIDLFGPGEFFGYVALLEDGTYKESAQALEPTKLAIIPKHEFEKMINSEPSVSTKFIRILANHISGQEQKLLGIAYNSLRKKVAEALTTLYEKYHSDESEPFSIEISRENLATLAGTAKESVVRTLSDFRGENLIEISGSTIKYINPRKLACLLN